MKRILNIPVEYLFLIIGLYFGLRFVFVNPPWQSNDEDRHFYRAWTLSQGVLKPEIVNGKAGNYLPVNLANTVMSFQGIRFNDQTKISKNYLKSQGKIHLNKSDKVFYDFTFNSMPFVPYIPAAIGINIGRLIGTDSPVSIGWYARIGGLFSYLVFIFFSIRIIPQRFKLLLLVLALNPMTLFQCSSVTYDTVAIGTSFFIISYVLYLAERKTIIDISVILKMFGLALLLRFSKDGYFLLPFALFIIPLRQFKNKGLYALTAVLLFSVLPVYNFLWAQPVATIINSVHAKPFQNDFLFDMSQNVAFQLHHDMPGIGINLFKNCMIQGKDWIVGAVGRFGYSYTPLPDSIVFFQVIFWIFILVTLPGTFALSKIQRLYLLLLALITTGFVISGFYFLSPVGAEQIFGLQGRYFIPVLPFLFIAIAQIKSSTEMKANYLNWIAVIWIAGMLFYTQSYLSDKLLAG